MLGDVFFMYKLSNSKYWCDSYTPSKLVICQAECDEIRFDFDDIYSRNGSRPQEFNGHFLEWINVSGSIACHDNQDPVDDVIVFKSDSQKEDIKHIQGE